NPYGESDSKNGGKTSKLRPIGKHQQPAIAVPKIPARPLFSGSCRKPHNSALAVATVVICSQPVDVFSPEIERLTFFMGVARPIVDPGDTGLVAADVIQHRFDDLRLHAPLRHPLPH